jgi:CheY-like chemotaxis protein
MAMAQILIVEDDQPYAEALALTLHLEGHEVLIAASAEEGIQFGLAYQPDLVLADWMLGGGLDGGEVCRRIQTASPRLKSIIITGYPNTLSKIRQQCKNMEAVIAKPFHKEEILDAVNRAIFDAPMCEPDRSLV